MVETPREPSPPGGDRAENEAAAGRDGTAARDRAGEATGGTAAGQGGEGDRAAGRRSTGAATAAGSAAEPTRSPQSQSAAAEPSREEASKRKSPLEAEVQAPGVEGSRSSTALVPTGGPGAEQPAAEPPAAPPAARSERAEARPTSKTRGSVTRTAGPASSRTGAAAPRGRAAKEGTGRRHAPVRPALSMTSQEEPLAQQDAKTDWLWRGVALAARLVSLAWLAASVMVWSRLVGFAQSDLALVWHAPEGPWLPLLTFAVAYPVVSVGLWLLSAWGGVLWVATVAITIGLAWQLPGSSPFGVGSLVFNLVAMGLVGALLVLRARRQAAEDD